MTIAGAGGVIAPPPHAKTKLGERTEESSQKAEIY